MRTINDARYTMWATVIPKLVIGDTQPTGEGTFVRTQDPDSFEIKTEWVPNGVSTPGTQEAQYTIRCYARGYTNLGFRSSANREVYVKGDYSEIESIQFDYPANVLLSRESYITNIRTVEADGTDYVWVDGNTGNPVVWEVQGTTPITDPFGKLLRNTTVLKRAEIQ